MNFFDSAIISFVNGYAQKSFLFDHFMDRLSAIQLLKGGVFVAIIWGVWFQRGSEAIVRRNRTIVLSTIVGTLIALACTRLLSMTMPFNVRPFANANIIFKIPLSFSGEVADWSSFPSNHAALFASLAAGLYLFSRRMLWFVIPYLIIVIFLPRIFLGLHYPTEILAGTILGIVSVLLTHKWFMAASIPDKILDWANEHPGMFYSFFFIMTYQIADLFYDCRNLAYFFRKLIHHLAGF